ncbi:hypothetical protein [Blastococcus sp. VKM Ac-2987]|uniref:hypothetical protein n=1 Tax=Blastococcus sp. VKM Ac-2987 TaxID=3004141 RepID=UPI0022AB70A1|nr:hypothetical protein [Blastococcus sp. VKM Ac-2987]MCZ2858447.1 hypothetical protein [Blastococcus sp. VKM Ac-2987]
MARSAPARDVDGLRLATGAGGRRSAAHVHWFRRIGDDAFSGSSLYACRCGQVRAAI